MYLRRLFYHKLTKLAYSLPSYLHLQLSITLFSWPFLHSWGLPITPATIVGNLLFAPFLLLFLLLSSALFFLELLSLPHWPAPLLEALTSIWSYFLATSSRSWLFILAHPPHWWQPFIPLITLLLLCLRISQKLRIALFITLILISGIILPRLKQSSKTTIPYFDKELILLQSGTHAILIDQDIILGRRLSAPKQITFTLLPHLIKNGITNLTVISTRPSIMVFKALSTLVKSFPVKTIYLPSFTGTLKNSGWQSWEHLLKKADHYGTSIIQLDTATTVSLGTRYLTITPEEKVSSQNSVTYHKLTLKP